MVQKPAFLDAVDITGGLNETLSLGSGSFVDLSIVTPQQYALHLHQSLQGSTIIVCSVTNTLSNVVLHAAWKDSRTS